jgi:imidazolonepropionase-like amidohydrolase
MAAIEAGTRVSAQVLGLENELGTIEEGKIADLILVAGNPLENIDILLKRESIRLVMQGGEIASGDF